MATPGVSPNRGHLKKEVTAKRSRIGLITALGQMFCLRLQGFGRTRNEQDNKEVTNEILAGVQGLGCGRVLSR